MTRRPLRPSAWLVVGAVVVLTACSPLLGGGPDPDPPVPPTPSSGLVLRDDLIDPQVVTWKSWRVVGDSTLEFTVTAGDRSCYGADAEVVETGTAVRVQLRVGWLPEAKGRDCDTIALESVVAVPLAGALGERDVEPLT